MALNPPKHQGLHKPDPLFKAAPCFQLCIKPKFGEQIYSLFSFATETRRLGSRNVLQSQDSTPFLLFFLSYHKVRSRILTRQCLHTGGCDGVAAGLREKKAGSTPRFFVRKHVTGSRQRFCEVLWRNICNTGVFAQGLIRAECWLPKELSKSH